MNSDFRERVFLPVILPLGVILGIAAIGLSLSRVLLAVPETVATFLALGVAFYVLLVASLIQARPRISSRALGAGVALGLVALVASGVVAASAGMRELHHAEEGGAEGGEGAAGGVLASDGDDGEGGGEVPPNTFVAVDIDFAAAPQALPAEADISLVNEGQVEHNVVFEELSEEPVVVAAPGETAEGSVTFPEAGDYRFYCSVPGHEALMNGTVTVEG